MIEGNDKDKMVALETVELAEGETTKTMKIGTMLCPEIRTRLIQFLKENLEVFAWSHEDMLGIAPEVIQHKLNVNPERKPVQQDEEFSPQNDTKQLTVGFILEVYYPE